MAIKEKNKVDERFCKILTVFFDFFYKTKYSPCLFGGLFAFSPTVQLRVLQEAMLTAST